MPSDLPGKMFVVVAVANDDVVIVLLLVLLILTKGLLLQTDIVRVSVIKSLGCHCQILTSTTCQEFVIVVVVCEVT